MYIIEICVKILNIIFYLLILIILLVIEYIRLYIFKIIMCKIL